MSPEVEAALIAGIVAVISLGPTTVVALRGIRATKQATDATIEQQRDGLNRTLKEQREELDRTLEEQHVRTLNERFATAADKLGMDKPATVRLAGVYAMAGLADDWGKTVTPASTCCAVTCAYRMHPIRATARNI